MVPLLPSEVARLVYGYLVECKCNEAARSFLENCPLLSECLSLLREGKGFNSSLAGIWTLKDLLNENLAIRSLVADYLQRLPENTAEQLRRCGSLVEQVQYLIDATRLGQTLLVQIKVPPQGSSGPASGGGITSLITGRTRAKLLNSSLKTKKSLSRSQGDDVHQNHDARNTHERMLSPSGAVLPEATPLESLPGLADIHTPHKKTDPRDVPSSSRSCTSPQGRCHKCRSTRQKAWSAEDMIVSEEFMSPKRKYLLSSKRKSIYPTPVKNQTPSKARRSHSDDIESPESLDFLVLQRALLDNKELHEKIAENINRVIHKPGEEETVEPETSPACDGMLSELNNAIKTIVDQTEQDPLFERFLEEIIGPIEEVTPSPTEMLSEGDDAMSDMGTSKPTSRYLRSAGDSGKKTPPSGSSKGKQIEDTSGGSNSDIPLKQRLRSARQRRSDSSVNPEKEKKRESLSLEDQNAAAIQSIVEAQRMSERKSAVSNEPLCVTDGPSDKENAPQESEDTQGRSDKRQDASEVVLFDGSLQFMDCSPIKTADPLASPPNTSQVVTISIPSTTDTIQQAATLSGISLHTPFQQSTPHTFATSTSSGQVMTFTIPCSVPQIANPMLQSQSQQDVMSMSTIIMCGNDSVVPQFINVPQPHLDDSYLQQARGSSRYVPIAPRMAETNTTTVLNQPVAAQQYELCQPFVVCPVSSMNLQKCGVNIPSKILNPVPGTSRRGRKPSRSKKKLEKKKVIPVTRAQDKSKASQVPNSEPLKQDLSLPAIMLESPREKLLGALALKEVSETSPNRKDSDLESVQQMDGNLKSRSKIENQSSTKRKPCNSQTVDRYCQSADLKALLDITHNSMEKKDPHSSASGEACSKPSTSTQKQRNTPKLKPYQGNVSGKRMSLSTPRRRRSHIRALDFTTPPKSGDTAVRRAHTSPKALQGKRSPKTSEKIIKSQKKHIKTSTASDVSRANKALFTSPPIATRTPTTPLSQAWDKVTGVGVILNDPSPTENNEDSDDNEESEMQASPTKETNRKGKSPLKSSGGNQKPTKNPTPCTKQPWDAALRSLVSPDCNIILSRNKSDSATTKGIKKNNIEEKESSNKSKNDDSEAKSENYMKTNIEEEKQRISDGMVRHELLSIMNADYDGTLIPTHGNEPKSVEEPENRASESSKVQESAEHVELSINKGKHVHVGARYNELRDIISADYDQAVLPPDESGTEECTSRPQDTVVGVQTADRSCDADLRDAIVISNENKLKCAKEKQLFDVQVPDQIVTAEDVDVFKSSVSEPNSSISNVDGNVGDVEPPSNVHKDKNSSASGDKSESFEDIEENLERFVIHGNDPANNEVRSRLNTQNAELTALELQSSCSPTSTGTSEPREMRMPIELAKKSNTRHGVILDTPRKEDVPASDHQFVPRTPYVNTASHEEDTPVTKMLREHTSFYKSMIHTPSFPPTPCVPVTPPSPNSNEEQTARAIDCSSSSYYKPMTEENSEAPLEQVLIDECKKLESDRTLGTVGTNSVKEILPVNNITDPSLEEGTVPLLENKGQEEATIKKKHKKNINKTKDTSRTPKKKERKLAARAAHQKVPSSSKQKRKSKVSNKKRPVLALDNFMSENSSPQKNSKKKLIKKYLKAARQKILHDDPSDDPDYESGTEFEQNESSNKKSKKDEQSIAASTSEPQKEESSFSEMQPGATKQRQEGHFASNDNLILSHVNSWHSKRRICRSPKKVGSELEEKKYRLLAKLKGGGTSKKAKSRIGVHEEQNKDMDKSCTEQSVSGVRVQFVKSYESRLKDCAEQRVTFDVQSKSKKSDSLTFSDKQQSVATIFTKDNNSTGVSSSVPSDNMNEDYAEMKLGVQTKAKELNSLTSCRGESHSENSARMAVEGQTKPKTVESQEHTPTKISASTSDDQIGVPAGQSSECEDSDFPPLRLSSDDEDTRSEHSKFSRVESELAELHGGEQMTVSVEPCLTPRPLHLVCKDLELTPTDVSDATSTFKAENKKKRSPAERRVSANKKIKALLGEDVSPVKNLSVLRDVHKAVKPHILRRLTESPQKYNSPIKFSSPQKWKSPMKFVSPQNYRSPTKFGHRSKFPLKKPKEMEAKSLKQNESSSQEPNASCSVGKNVVESKVSTPIAHTQHQISENEVYIQIIYPDDGPTGNSLTCEDISNFTAEFELPGESDDIVKTVNCTISKFTDLFSASPKDITSVGAKSDKELGNFQNGGRKSSKHHTDKYTRTYNDFNSQLYFRNRKRWFDSVKHRAMCDRKNFTRIDYTRRLSSFHKKRASSPFHERRSQSSDSQRFSTSPDRRRQSSRTTLPWRHHQDQRDPRVMSPTQTIITSPLDHLYGSERGGRRGSRGSQHFRHARGSRYRQYDFPKKSTTFPEEKKRSSSRESSHTSKSSDSEKHRSMRLGFAETVDREECKLRSILRKRSRYPEIPGEKLRSSVEKIYGRPQIVLSGEDSHRSTARRSPSSEIIHNRYEEHRSAVRRSGSNSSDVVHSEEEEHRSSVRRKLGSSEMPHTGEGKQQNEDTRVSAVKRKPHSSVSGHFREGKHNSDSKSNHTDLVCNQEDKCRFPKDKRPSTLEKGSVPMEDRSISSTIVYSDESKLKVVVEEISGTLEREKRPSFSEVAHTSKEKCKVSLKKECLSKEGKHMSGIEERLGSSERVHSEEDRRMSILEERLSARIHDAEDRHMSALEKRFGSSERIHSEEDRRMSALEKRFGSSERIHSEEDRRMSALEKRFGSSERVHSEEDRRMSALEKRCGSSERVHSEEDRRMSILEERLSARIHDAEDRHMSALEKRFGSSEKIHNAEDRRMSALDKRFGSSERIHIEEDRRMCASEKRFGSSKRVHNEEDRHMSALERRFESPRMSHHEEGESLYTSERRLGSPKAVGVEEKFASQENKILHSSKSFLRNEDRFNSVVKKGLGSSAAIQREENNVPGLEKTSSCTAKKIPGPSVLNTDYERSLAVVPPESACLNSQNNKRGKKVRDEPLEEGELEDEEDSRQEGEDRDGKAQSPSGSSEDNLMTYALVASNSAVSTSDESRRALRQRIILDRSQDLGEPSERQTDGSSHQFYVSSRTLPPKKRKASSDEQLVMQEEKRLCSEQRKITCPEQAVLNRVTVDHFLDLLHGEKPPQM